MVSRTIMQLMSVPTENQDVKWLKESLATALKIEYSTVPPYLCALWSIEQDFYPHHPYYRSIRDSIIQEEMLHMGLICNILVALDAQPQLVENHPTYPGPLPVGLLNGDDIYLQGFSKPALEVFLRIEYPEDGPITIGNDPSLELRELRVIYEGPIESAETIGQFYTQLEKRFQDLDDAGELPSFNPTNQLTHYFDALKTGELFKINNVADVSRAIEIIKRQGEGSSTTSPEDTGINDLSHYYRFLEMYKDRKIVENPGGGEPKYVYDDAVTEFPDVRPMAIVPSSDGYPDVSDDVQQNMDEFNTKYTEMLRQLEAAWNGSPDYLIDAIQKMFSLTPIAYNLMNTEIPGDPNGKTYGPYFKVLPAVILPDESDSGEENPTWADIEPMFTNYVSCMNNYGVNLGNYTSVKDNADRILYQITTGGMPPGGGFPENDTNTFRRWVELGMPE